MKEENQIMMLKHYQKKSRKTALYPDIGRNFVYPTLGLVGEAGEVAEKVKKILRDKAGTASTNDISEIEKELGDVLWYVSQLATEFGLSLEKIAQINLEKLQSRYQRGVIGGSGDNR